MENTSAFDSLTITRPLENTTYSNISAEELLMGPINPREWYRYGFEFELYGYVLPAMAVVILLMNGTMLKVFVTNKLLSPTNILIGTIALFDILTITIPSVPWFYVFGWLRYHYYLPFDWCRMWHDVIETTPSTSHGIAIVLNVVLVIQRYVIIAFPYNIKSICSRLNTCICVVVVIIAFSMPGFFSFFEFEYFPTMLPSESNPNETMVGCLVGISPWIKQSGLNLYISVRLYIRAATALISSTTATVFCILTLRKCKQISLRRKHLTQNISKTQNIEARLTMTTIAIIAAFVITELPSVIIITLDAFTNMSGIVIIPGNLLYTITVINNTFIASTGALNFIIYFYFCEKFRRACFASWCCKGKRNLSVGRQHDTLNTHPTETGLSKRPSSLEYTSSNSISENPTISSSCGSSNLELSSVTVHV